MSSFSSQTAVALLRESCKFVEKHSYVFLDQSDRAHSKEKLQLITIMRCSTSTVFKLYLKIWPILHKSNGYDGNNITTTVNCLEIDLPNLYINGGMDTIRNLSPKATVEHRG